MRQIEVVFCGDSVYLSGLAASLRQDSRLRIVEIEAGLDKAANELKMLRPEAVVGEGAGLGVAEALRAENPGLLVIAVEAATDSLAALGGRGRWTAAVTELARVIMEGGPAGASAAGEADEGRGRA